MEFEEQYLTYEEYKALGGTLDLMPFNLLEFEAKRKIDGVTQNRLVGIKNIPQEVKMCEFKIIDVVLKDYEEGISRGKNSETVGSYSVSYRDIKDIIDNKMAEINDIISNYLYGVIINGEHILYCGV